MENRFTVMTDKEIQQRLAGYKANYTRRINAASRKDRVRLESEREAFIGEKTAELKDEQRKQIQRRAGHLSWITRKKNATVKMDEPDHSHEIADEAVVERKCKNASVAIERKKAPGKKAARKSRHVNGVEILHRAR